MNKATKIGFIIVFLGIIYAVPIVQTVYEFRTNAGHRIQMLDLPVDLFITPLEKSRASTMLIDSILASIDFVGHELEALKAAAQDSLKSADFETAAELCEASVVRLSILKNSVIDYNRHVAGSANTFAARDTLKPYYTGLTKASSDFATILEQLRLDTPDTLSLTSTIRRLKKDCEALRISTAGSSYFSMVLTALRRVMVGANYLRPYEAEMEKSSVFATTLRPWMQFGYYRMFGDLGSKGVRGAHDWLFYRPDVEYLVRPDVFNPDSRTVDANDIAVTEDIIGAIVDFKNQLAARGIDLLFVAMPAKPSIYPDMVNPSARPASAGTISHTRRVLERLSKAGVETLDLFNVFAHERGNDAVFGDSLYLRTDTHFKNRAVLAAARAVADRVRRYPWYERGSVEFASDTVLIPRYGDVAEMIGMPASIVAKRRFPFVAESTVCHQVSKIVRDGENRIVKRTLYKDDYRGSKILVLGDSYSRIFQTDPPKSAGWIANLARELSQPVASLVNDGGASTLVRRTLARKPGLLRNKKLVIWEVVERDFRFGDEGWKKIRIVEKP
jgi:hypothetical protein